MRALSRSERPWASSSAEALVDRELGGHAQDEDGVDDALFADEFGGSLEHGGADVVAEDRDERGAVGELLEVRRALGRASRVVVRRSRPCWLAVGDVDDDPDREPPDPGERHVEVEQRHHDEREAGAEAADEREERKAPSATRSVPGPR